MCATCGCYFACGFKRLLWPDLALEVLRHVYITTLSVNTHHFPHFSLLLFLLLFSLTPVMVGGCKDDPRHKFKLKDLSLSQQSPTLNEQETRVARWLHNFSRPLPTSPHTSTLTSIPTSEQKQDAYAPDPMSRAPLHLINYTQRPTIPQSGKRKALADLEPLLPRKSLRLELKQKSSGYKMPPSPSKKKQVGKGAGVEAKGGADEDKAKATMGSHVTRAHAQTEISTANSSDKENRGAIPDAFTTIPPLQPVAGLTLSDPGSPSRRKHPASRPQSPTKTPSTKSGKVQAPVDKRERLSLLNPPVKFFPRDYLGKLGKSIQPLVKSLWIKHIDSDDEGFIPQCFKVRQISLSRGG